MWHTGGLAGSWNLERFRREGFQTQSRHKLGWWEPTAQVCRRLGEHCQANLPR